MTEVAQITQQNVERKWLQNLVIKGTPIVTAGAVAATCAYVALNDPDSKTLFPKCGFYALTGYYCPGCGMTRALHHLLRGDVLKAFQYNAILVVGIPVLIYLYVWWVMWAFTGKELPKLKLNRKVTIIILCLVGIFIVGRNLPGEVAAFFALDR